VLVLFVEDFEEVHDLYAPALEAVGMNVFPARTINEAESALSHVVPDLVVMDRELPDGDGFALASRLKRRHAVPVIGFTATPISDAMRAAHAAGLDGFVAKPCEPAKLVALARMLLTTC
jgi:DNA-binding response OmpR family regulator